MNPDENERDLGTAPDPDHDSGGGGGRTSAALGLTAAVAPVQAAADLAPLRRAPNRELHGIHLAHTSWRRQKHDPASGSR